MFGIQIILIWQENEQIVKQDIHISYNKRINDLPGGTESMLIELSYVPSDIDPLRKVYSRPKILLLIDDQTQIEVLNCGYSI